MIFRFDQMTGETQQQCEMINTLFGHKRQIKYLPKVTVTLCRLAGTIEYFEQMDFNLAFNKCDV